MFYVLPCTSKMDDPFLVDRHVLCFTSCYRIEWVVMYIYARFMFYVLPLRIERVVLSNVHRHGLCFMFYHLQNVRSCHMYRVYILCFNPSLVLLHVHINGLCFRFLLFRRIEWGDRLHVHRQGLCFMFYPAHGPVACQYK